MMLTNNHKNNTKSYLFSQTSNNNSSFHTPTKRVSLKQHQQHQQQEEEEQVVVVDPSTPSTCNTSFDSSIDTSNNSNSNSTITDSITETDSNNDSPTNSTFSSLMMNQNQQQPHPHKRPNPTTQARTQIINLGSTLGTLCHKIITHTPQFDPKLSPPFTKSSLIDQDPTSFWTHPNFSQDRNDIYESIQNVIKDIFVISNICGVDLGMAIKKKMELNGKKYPVNLCKGKSGKYTTYSSQTGVTKTNQSTLDPNDNNVCNNNNNNNNNKLLLNDLKTAIREFALGRDWSKFHTPRNIILAMMGEYGELAELFQWEGDDEDKFVNAEEEEQQQQQNKVKQDYGLKYDGWTMERIDKVQQEIADVAIYCLRLADVVGMEEVIEEEDTRTSSSNSKSSF